MSGLMTYISFILSIASIVSLLIAGLTFFAKFIRWKDRMDALGEEIKSVKEENRILTIGVLACLKGLKEQGCNGPVTEAINKLETYIIDNAHQ